jgi:hypothetical protein
VPAGRLEKAPKRARHLVEIVDLAVLRTDKEGLRIDLGGVYAGWRR